MLSLLLVLVLAESFDNFSLGKLISITREARQKEKEVQKLENRNHELLNQLINISLNNSQTQTHTNVYGDYHATPEVTKASEKEVEDNKSEEVKSNESLSRSSTENNSQSRNKTRYNLRKAEEIALENYIKLKGIHPSNVIKEVKLTSQFHFTDRICDFEPIFDAYFHDEEDEIFVEFRAKRSFPLRERLYLMLSKLDQYRKVKKCNVYLELVLMNFPDDNTIISNSTERILKSFTPAITNGLMRIREVDFSDVELNLIKEQDDSQY